MRGSRFQTPANDDSDRRNRWLATYANFVTLLFAMFLVLYAISYFNEKGLSTFVTTLSVSQGYPVDTMDSTQLDSILREIESLQQRSHSSPETAPPVAGSVADGGGEATDNPTQELLHHGSTRSRAERMEIELNSNLLFKGGSADLTSHARRRLEDLSLSLNTISSPLEVEGYTDTIPISTGRFPSNWELSAARAASVTRELINNGVDPARLTVVGYGEFRPREGGKPDGDQTLNRRVLIVIRADPSNLPAPLRTMLQGGTG